MMTLLFPDLIRSMDKRKQKKQKQKMVYIKMMFKK